MKTFAKRSMASLSLIAVLAAVPAPVGAEVGGTVTRELPEPILISAEAARPHWVGHWAEQDLMDLLEFGLASTRLVDDVRVTPDGAIQVSDAALFLLQMGSFPIAADRNVIDQAVEQGLIEAEEIADANGAVTREQFARWTARAMGLQMLAEYARIYMTTSFVDDDQLDAQYRNAVAILQEQGVIAGDGTSHFAPKRAITYAEACRILYNVRVKVEAAQE